MALTIAEGRDRSGLQVGDEIAFGVLGNGRVVICAVRGIGKNRRGFSWEDGSDSKTVIYPFIPDELQKLATLLCEVAGLKGEIRLVREEKWLCVFEVVA